jgi:dihydrofolate reductase
MRKSIIVAASQNGVIGKDGQLPWHLPGDLKRFKELTMGHTLIMGRKTYESLPPKLRPLPGRTTIRLSRTVDLLDEEACLKQHEDEARLENTSPGLLCMRSLAQALQFAASQRGETEVFICGGGEVYREALPLVDRVYLTVVERDFEGDTSIEIPFWSKKEIEIDYLVGFAGATWRLVQLERVDGELPHRFEIWDRVR